LIRHIIGFYAWCIKQELKIFQEFLGFSGLIQELGDIQEDNG
jgi:hypothetical protein